MSLLVAGAEFREILGDSGHTKCCIFPYKMRLQDGTSEVSDHNRIMLGSWSNCLSFGGSNSLILR